MEKGFVEKKNRTNNFMELYQRNDDSDEDDEEYVPNGSDSEEEVEEETDSKKIVSKHSPTKTNDELDELEPETEENIYNLYKDQTRDVKEVIQQGSSNKSHADDVESFWKEMNQSSSSSSSSNNPSTSTTVVDKKEEDVEEPASKKQKIEDSSPLTPLLEPKSPSTPSSGRPTLKRPNLDSYLNSLQKKSKETIVNSSKRNWQQFKQKEGIEHELTQYVKDGFLEKQAFLERSKLKQEELDKQTRLSQQRR